MKKTVEELEQALQATQEENLKLKSLLKTALDRSAELEAKINRNSKNSSKSPSSDQKSDTPEKPKKVRASRKGYCLLKCCFS